MIEQALAVGEGPAQRFELDWGQCRKGQRELHDVVEWEHDTHHSAATLAPSLTKRPLHGIEMTPSTARHSAGPIRWLPATRTEWSAALISRCQ